MDGNCTNCNGFAGTGYGIGGLIGYVGGVSLSAQAVVENCYVKGNIEGTFDIGGCIGRSYGIIKNCYSRGEVYRVINFNIWNYVGFLDLTSWIKTLNV